jgi:hypothetical protein
MVLEQNKCPVRRILKFYLHTLRTFVRRYQYGGGGGDGTFKHMFGVWVRAKLQESDQAQNSLL